eukprot:1101517_1
MSTNELPTIAPRDAVCYIDFEFQMPYHEPLKNVALLQDCLSIATNDVLTGAGHQELELKAEDFNLQDIDHTNKRIKIGGWVECKDQHRQILMEALRVAQKGRKISHQIIERTGIKRSKVSIQQFSTKYSNDQNLHESFLSRTHKSFQEYQRRANSIQSNPEEKKQNDDFSTNEDTKDDNDNSNQNDTNEDHNVDDEQDEQDEDKQPPLMPVHELGAQSVVIHDVVDEDEYDVISKPQSQDNDSSFAMVDGLDDGDDQSSNEEQKQALRDKLGIDLDEYADVDAGDTSAQSGDDFRSVTPIVPGVDTLGIDSVKKTNVHDTEVKRLRTELVTLKQQHAEELDHFNNTIMSLKNQNTIQRKKSRISMKIDDAIMKKQMKQETDDKVMALESELYASREDKSLELQRVQLRHQTELKNFEIQLRQTQQHHVLELENVRKTHQIQTQQLQSQIRALTGSLERESEKDRKIYDLSEESEQLKVDMERTIQNYENVIDKLNAESEENIRREIDKRIRETAQFKRDLNDLQQTLKREKSKKNRLEGEIRQLQDENEQKDSMISQMKNMFVNEKKKAASLERKLQKSKRNIHHNQSVAAAAEEKNNEMLARGKHLRKKSNTFKNRTVTMRQLETGDAVIEIEKTTATDAMEDVYAFASMYDPDVDTDSDYDHNAEDAESGAMDDGNEEIALKEQQIVALREKVMNLNEKIDVLKEEKAEEMQLLQQKIGSLQQKMEIEDENFMKQNQMLEFKLNQKENYAQKLQDDLHQLRKEHRKEIRSMNATIEKYQGQLIEKDREIVTLGENLDLMEDENARLKDVEDDCVAELEEIDEHYQNMLDEMRQQNDDTTQQREEETKSLQNKVHVQSKSIAELQSLLSNMKVKEIEMRAKEQQINEEEEEAEDIQWRGQMQAEPQQEMEQEEEEVNEEEEEEMKRVIQDMRMQHTQQIEKHAQQYQNMQNELKNEIQSLTNEITHSKSNFAQLEMQLEVAEKSRISLLQSFMREMDRMRDEIRRLNAQTG